jgi:hypothetical protein
VSLGGIIDLPSEIDHAFRHVASGTGRPQELEESGVTDGLVWISVGVEDWRDLLADFEQELAAVAGRCSDLATGFDRLPSGASKKYLRVRKKWARRRFRGIR